MRKVPVLIVGGGPVGLSMALALARQNVQSLLIEQHAGREEHPRARGVSMRTMELFRLWGDIDELLKYEFPKEAIRFIWCESLQGKEITRIEIPALEQYSHGPIGGSFTTQDCVELYLHQMLRKHPEAEVEFSKEMISFEETDQGINVRLLNRLTNEEEFVQADYVIAADGAHSRVRKQLGIDLVGPDNLARSCSVFCELDIAKWTAHRPAIAYLFADPTLLNNSIFPAYGKNRWTVGLRFTESNTKEDFTEEYCVNEIRRMLALPNLDIKIIKINFWTMAAQIATQYRHGNIFLVGDAAHRLPPTGGLGMNTGVQDAHNLAWKLAFVLKHQVSDALLDSYYEERAPVAERNMKWAMNNAKRLVDIAAAIRAKDNNTLQLKLQDQQKHLNFEGLDLGFTYYSNTISIESDHYIPTTLPGSRAPYVLLKKDGFTLSTLDLFEKDYVLLVGSEGQAWQTAVNEFNKTSPIPIKCYRIADDGDYQDPNNDWQQAYEISSTGAVLVRPDGHVAWRSITMADDGLTVLAQNLGLPLFLQAGGESRAELPDSVKPN